MFFLLSENTSCSPNFSSQKSFLSLILHPWRKISIKHFQIRLRHVEDELYGNGGGYLVVVMVEVDKTPKEFLCDLGKLTDFFKALLRGRLLKDEHHRAAGMISFVHSDPPGMTATTHMLRLSITPSCHHGFTSFTFSQSCHLRD